MLACMRLRYHDVCMYVIMCVCVYVWMDGWTRWMDWMYGWMDHRDGCVPVNAIRLCVCVRVCVCACVRVCACLRVQCVCTPYDGE